MKQSYAIRCIILILLTALFGCGGPSGSGSSLLPSDNQGGNSNPPPSLFPPTTPPPIPVITTANALADRVELDWSDDSTREDGFTIERDGIEIASTPRNISVWTDTDVQPDTTYCYAVRSYNIVGKSNASPLECATIPLPPLPPEPSKWILPQGAQIRSLAVDQTTGELYAAGQTAGDVFLAKVSPDGTVAWTKQWGTAEQYDIMGDVVVFEGNIFFNWRDSSTADVWIVRLDTAGNEISAFSDAHDVDLTAIDNTAIYSKNGRKIDYQSTLLVWQQSLPWNAYAIEGVAIYGATVYYTGHFVLPPPNDMFMHGYTAAVDSATGNVIWTSDWGEQINPTGRNIAANASGVYTFGENLLVLRHDLVGNLLWTYQDTVRSGSFSHIVTDDTAVYAMGGIWNGCGLTKIINDGALVWQISIVGESLAIFNNVLFVADDSNIIHRYDALTGSALS